VTAETESYLREPAFDRLWRVARAAYERNGGLAGQALIASLSPEEAAALNGLLRRRKPFRSGRDARLALAALDETLREFACPLDEWLVQVGGRLVNRPAQRAQTAAAQATLWAELERRAAAADPRLNEVIEDLRRSGLLKRLAGGDELGLGRRTLTLLANLLGRGSASVDIAALAAEHCGDAKALNDGRPLATLVLRGLCVLAGEEPARDAAARRALWERFGVICDPLSSHVLCLNLPLEADTPLGVSAAAYAAAGEPMRLTLRQLRRFPPRFRIKTTVYVCENPTVVSAAAEALAERCAPLVCTDGRPVVAVSRLLERAAAQGCPIRYHGDFDWPGVEMAANAMRQYSAMPWRLGAVDYRCALSTTAITKPLEGRPHRTLWDPELAVEMGRQRLVVEEESVIADLLPDLSRSGDCSLDTAD
jgi:uncharacterized protein (TIGR02679 family)